MAKKNTVAKPQTTTPATETKKSGRKAAPENETKAERFLRLVKPRMTKTLKAIKTVGNLAGSGYEYTPEQIDKMRAAVDAAVKEAFAKFAPKDASGKKVEAGFDFS